MTDKGRKHPQRKLAGIPGHVLPDQPVIFRRGAIADAEPAVPGWRMKVDDIFAA